MTRHIVCTAAIIGALASTASAYPPAPGVTLKGLVRDEFGWVLRDTGAEVVVRQGTVVIGRAPIVNEVDFDYNYRVNLPVDSNVKADPYRAGALLLASTYSVDVEVGGVIYTPIETLLGELPIPEPGTVIALDLTLGDDTDGDGLPDDWELWQLQAAGMAPGDFDYNLAQLGNGDADSDGLTDLEEYLAGTFALFAFSNFRLEAESFHSPNLVEFNYYGVRDRAYRLQASTDMVTWEPVPVLLDSPFSFEVSAWTSNRTGWLKLYAPPRGPRRFYRLEVR